MGKRLEEIKTELANLKSQEDVLYNEMDKCQHEHFWYIYGEIRRRKSFRLYLKPFRNKKKLALLEKRSDEATNAFYAVHLRIRDLEHELECMLA